jgi:RHS repeat-associated protein
MKQNPFITIFAFRKLYMLAMANDKILFRSTVDSHTNSYHPFGKRIDNLSFKSGTNQLKYNGKELQSQSLAGRSLDWYDYGARFYDPTLGRFHTIDRMAEKYVGLTPYQYAGNNPVRFIDVNGDYIYATFQGRQYRWVNGRFLRPDINEEPSVDEIAGLKSLAEALKELSTCTVGQALLDFFNNNEQNVRLVAAKKNGWNKGAVEYNKKFEGTNNIPTTGSREKSPFWLGLGHELAHARDHRQRGDAAMKQWQGDARDTEIVATHWENQALAEKGLSLRTHYEWDSNPNNGFGAPVEKSRILNSNGESLFFNSNGDRIPDLPVQGTTAPQVLYKYMK